MTHGKVLSKTLRVVRCHTHPNGLNEMVKGFKVGEHIALVNMETGKQDRFVMTTRTETRATLASQEGRTIYASIRTVRYPLGECLLADGFHAVFSSEQKEDEEPANNPEGPTSNLGKRRGFSDKDIQTLREMASQGVTYEEMRKVLRCSKERIRNAIKKHGIETTTKAGRRIVYAIQEEQVPAVKRMLADGCSVREIAEAFGVSEYKVRVFINDMNLEREKKPSLFTEDDITRIRHWLAEGMSRADICERLHVSGQTLALFMASNGVKVYGTDND